MSDLQTAYPGRISSFDPIKADDIYSMNAILQIYEGLFGYNIYGEIIPVLAENWQISADGLHYIITIKKNVLFHDGTKLTVDDVIYSFKRLSDKSNGSVNAWVMNAVTGKNQRFEKIFQKIDNYSFTISLEKPYPCLLDLLASFYTVIVPKNEKSKTLHNHPTGTGPYILNYWHPGKQISFNKFNGYHGQTPYFTNVRILIDPAYKTSLNLFNQKKLNFLILSNYHQLKKVIKSENINIIPLNQYTTWLIGYNLSLNKYKNKNLRKAIYHAIDKSELINILGTSNKKTEKYLPFGMLGPNEQNDKYGYNISLAKHFFNKARLSDEFAVQIQLFNGLTNVNKIKTFLESSLEKIGIKSIITIHDFNDFVTLIQKQQHEIFIIQVLPAYPDPDSLAYPYLHSNGTTNLLNIKDSIIDIFLEKARHSINISERVELYKKINSYLHKNNLLIPISHENVHIITDKNISAQEINTFSIWNLRYKDLNQQNKSKYVRTNK